MLLKPLHSLACSVLARPLNGLQVNIFRIKDGGKLLIRFGAHQGGH